MSYSKVTSELLYIESYIDSLELENNNIKINDNNEKEFGMDIVPIGYCEDDKYRYISIKLQIEVYIKDGDEKGSIKLNMIGKFSSLVSIQEDTFRELSLIHGGASLYSIARAKIEALSAMAFVSGKINLPMVDMTEFYKSKNKKSTTQI